MKFKWIFLAGLGVLAFYGTMRFCLDKTGKFIVTDMMNDRPFDPAFETRPLNVQEEQEVRQALSQTYTYFGCGGQAFVFFSEDGNYVVKFFKQNHFWTPTHLNYIPFAEKYRDRKFAKRYKRIRRDYESYKIGFEEFGERAGLLFLHLNKTDHLHIKLKVIDKLHIEHAIDLDTTDFIVQRRAGLVFPTIHRLMQQGAVVEAKNAVSEVVHLIVARCKHGLRDKDPNIATNCGILYPNNSKNWEFDQEAPQKSCSERAAIAEKRQAASENKTSEVKPTPSKTNFSSCLGITAGRAIKIDVGRFIRDPLMAKPLYYKPELYTLTRSFRTWLKQNYPELVETLDTEVLKVIAE
jgi:hypothetical protein